MGSSSSGGERVALGIATGGASEIYRSGQEGGAGKYFGVGAIGFGAKKAQDTLNAPAEEARKAAEELARKQKEAADKLAGEKALVDKNAAEASAKEAAGLEARTAKARQAKMAQGAKGRSDTILTGPLGLTAAGPKSGKTLLGS